MRRESTRRWLVALHGAAIAACPAVALGLPSARTVEFRIHETPGEISSPVISTVTLRISPAVQFQDQVGWLITQVDVVVSGSLNQCWSDTNPTITTVDNPWWVTHADVENPQTNEFLNTPTIEGTAMAVSGSSSELNYSMLSRTSSTPNLYGGNVADATYALRLVEAPEEPIVEGDEEPVEIEGGQNPS